MRNNQPTISNLPTYNKKLWIPIIILSIMVIFLVIFSLTKTNELTSTQDTLLITQSQLSITNTKLVDTEIKLTTTSNQLSDTQEQLSDTQEQLTATETQLTSVKSQLAITSNQLSDTQEQLTSVQGQLTSTQAELTLYKATWGSVVASDIIPPFQDADIVNQSEVTDQTWVQLQNFIISDKTDQNTYVPNVYTCGEYARDVHNNAEAAGIRSAYVIIEFSDDWHACNAFKTTDRGLVFIDCTGLMAGQEGPSNRDKIVSVKLGNHYIPNSLFSQPGWLLTWGDMGTILDVQVYW